MRFDANKRPRWQTIGVVIAAVLGSAFLLFALWMMTQSPWKGEVGAILHGGFIMIGLGLAAFFVAVTVWFMFWRIRWLRWLGIVALLCTVLTLTFGRQVQWWMASQRMDRMDARAELHRDIQADFYEQMRAAMDDRSAAIAIFPAYMARMNQRDMYDGTYSDGWDAFGTVFGVYAYVFFDHKRPSSSTVRRPPFAWLYCSFFEDEFGWMITTDDQRARAAVACPDIWG